MTRCPQCQAENDDALARCARCGSGLRNVDRATRKYRRADVPPPIEAAEASDPATPRTGGAPRQAALISSVLDGVFLLSADETVTIGRTEENNIVMPVHQVSRQHALLKWDGEGYALVDRQSTNGTYVNGEPIQRRRLKAGDKIGIGPFELKFVEGSAGISDVDGNVSTVVVAIPGAFSGEVVQVSVPEIVQLVELNQKTGVLEFKDGETRGKLYFDRGRALHAEFRALLGDEAALALLALTKGSFRFLGRSTSGIKTTIKRATSALLLEAARRQDEPPPAGDAEDTAVNR